MQEISTQNKKNKIFKKIDTTLRTIKKEAVNTKRKSAVLVNVTTQSSSDNLVILPVRYLEKYICLPIGIQNTRTAIKLAIHLDGKVDVIFVDAENKLQNCRDIFDIIFTTMQKSRVYAIKGNDLAADAAFAIIVTILKNISRKKIFIVGSGNIGSKLALKLVECGSQVSIMNSTKSSSVLTASAINRLKPVECRSLVTPVTKKKIPTNLDCIIGFTRSIPAITKEMVRNLKEGGLLLDGGTETISESGIIEAKRRNIRILRLDIRLGFAYYADIILNTENFIENIVGEMKVNGIHIVAGGVIGERGDVIVDNIKKPTKIIGIANGKGGTLKEGHYQKNINIIKKFIN